MNDVLIRRSPKRWSGGRALVKGLVWRAVRSVALGGLYAWSMEDHWFRIERHTMALPGLGPELRGAKLAHISDLHCCPIVVDSYLRNCIQTVNELDVDFVVMTGDFITGPKHYARRIANVLSELHYRVAAVACLGNHDYGVVHPAGLGAMRGLADYTTEQLSKKDIFVARNECRVFTVGNSSIQFVGLEDYWTDLYDPLEAFELAEDNLPTVGLVHNPDAAAEVARYGATWVLSGHTHGMCMPNRRFYDMILPTERRMDAGHFALGNGRHVYVNRGLSYARRVNLNTRPEITVFTLEAEGQN